MTFNEFLSNYSRRFPKHGSFELLKGEKIKLRTREGGVPKQPGVYLIYARNNRRVRLLYVGRSGTLRSNGTFKGQRLIGRLSAKQKGIPRQRFYQEQIAHLQLDALVFQWFITFADKVRIIPAKAEADLLQAYFDEYNRLPKWNESI